MYLRLRKPIYTSVLDANTFEPIGASIYYEKDGNAEQIITEHYEYDSDLPRTVDVLAGVFERYNPNVVTVTATAHPGTDKEITKSVTVPANSMVSFYTPDMTAPEYFKDYECTQPYTKEWDMMSDLTVYIRDGGKRRLKHTSDCDITHAFCRCAYLMQEI